MPTCAELKPYKEASVDFADTLMLKASLARRRQDTGAWLTSYQDLDEVLVWKLRGQYRRLVRRGGEDSDARIRQVTSLALSEANAPDSVRFALRQLLLLKWVGMGVATSILGLCLPHLYAPIDFRSWRAAFGEEKKRFGFGDYERYLAWIRNCARELGWLPQEVDLALWAYDMANQRS